MDTALAIYNQFDQLQRAALALYKSQYFSNDVKSDAQAIVKVMAGAELGIPPFASMTGIHIIQGKPALGANVIATLIKNDPRYNYRVLEMSDTVCRIQFFESGEPCGVSEFTAQDAKKAGTKNMDKFPKNMLFARAISNGAKWYTPGIFGGAPVYTPDELGADVDEDGNIVEGSYISTQQPQPVQAQAANDAPMTDDELVVSETPAAKFFDAVTALINRYENVHATKAAAKKLGFTAVPGTPAARVDMYRAIKAHAAERDAEDSEAKAEPLFDLEENGAYIE